MNFDFKDYLKQYFKTNDYPFFVIYDSLSIFKELIDSLELPGFEILFIDSKFSPSELIDRKTLINTFDEEFGWYITKWIIYISGEYSQQVEDTQIFLYYANLGISFHFHSIWDILTDSKFNLAESKFRHFDYENHLTLNTVLSNLLNHIPLSCFINSKKEIVESSFWMTFLRSFQDFEDNLPLSPVFLYHKTTKSLFTIESVILDLIYCIDFNEFQFPIEDPFNKFNDIFIFINNEFDSFFPFTDDFNKNFRILIRQLFTQSTPQSKKIKKGKLKDLDEFFTTQASLSNSLQKKLLFIFDFWLKSNHPILSQRFQFWSELIRSDNNLTISNDSELENYQTNFSYSGDLDLSLIKYLISTNHSSKTALENKIQTLIEYRKDAWNQYASLWWDYFPLFNFHSNSITLKELWSIIQEILIVKTLGSEKSKKWSTLQETALNIEKSNRVISTIKTEIFDQLQSLSFISQFINESKNKIAELRLNYNHSFIEEFFQKDFFTKNESIIQTSLNLFNQAKESIKTNQRIGIVFIDALRSDLAVSLIEALEIKMNHSKGSIKYQTQILHSSYTLLPSITGLGWPFILANESKVDLLIKDNKLQVQLTDGSKSFVLHTPTDRNKRIESILSNSDLNIQVEELSQSDITESIKHLKSILLDSEKAIIPVMWYKKFDNHDNNEKDFFESAPKDLEAISDYIFQLHMLSFQKVFIFTDHGFLFVKNDNLSKNIPNKENFNVNKRYAIANKPLASFDQSKYPDWLFWSPAYHSLLTNIQEDFTIIVPKDFSTFNKLGQLERFTHGGLSYLECNVHFITSECVLKPKVQIISVEPVEDHERETITGNIILKNVDDTLKLLEVKVKGSEPTQEGEILKELKFKLNSVNFDCRIEPNTNKLLKPGNEIIFKIYLKNFNGESILELEFIDDKKETIKVENIRVKAPAFYTAFDF